jgi:hypothetical protein
VNGAAKYIEFLKQAFDAVELTRSSSSDGRVLNASVRITRTAHWLLLRATNLEVRGLLLEAAAGDNAIKDHAHAPAGGPLPSM